MRIQAAFDPMALTRRLSQQPMRRSVWWLVVVVALVSAWWTPAMADTVAPSDDRASERSDSATIFDERPADGDALRRASDASIGVMVRAVEGSASADTLGETRRGTGVVISPDGVVLTIGYLILEAEEVDLVLDDGRQIPARPLAYDPVTGFGLVQALLPLPVAAVPLGSSASVREDETLMFVSGGEGGAVSPAHLVARGQFAGYWEYLIDGAMMTAPMRPDHSGAGLYNRHGELVGIGSLALPDAAASVSPNAGDLTRKAPGRHDPGNLFVPVDLLKPILAELRSKGRSQASRRAWLGLNCMVLDGVLTVLRVSRDGPAQAAGLLPGDRILRLDGTPVSDLPAFYQRLWTGGDAERDVQLRVRRGNESQDLSLHSVDRQATLKQATGI
ncbi:MAG: S1C family serine protease [Leptothrix sp. (in: b-proteobacteria)]